MNIWLCPVKPKNWRIIQSAGVFGVPKRALKSFNHVQPGDLLVFHILNPVNGIVAAYRVKSDVFESHQNIWGKNRYPFRVKIEFISNLTNDESKPLPLRFLFGKIDNKDGVIVEPYLRNVWITKVSKSQYKKLLIKCSHKT